MKPISRSVFRELARTFHEYPRNKPKNPKFLMPEVLEEAGFEIQDDNPLSKNQRVLTLKCETCTVRVAYKTDWEIIEPYYVEFVEGWFPEDYGFKAKAIDTRVSHSTRVMALCRVLEDMKVEEMEYLEAIHQ